MKKNTIDYRISQLIVKEQLEDLNAHESDELTQWIKESDGNKQLYLDIRSGERRTDRDFYVENLDKKKAWRKVEKEIGLNKRTLPRRNWMLRFAAVITFGILVGSLAYLSNMDVFQAEQQVADFKIVPGSTKAVLQLQNGEFVHLEETESDSVAIINGTTIRNRNGKIEYLSQNNIAAHLEPIMNTIKIPVGGEYQLTLADGTRVWLNSQSEIKYPVQFVGNTRRVEVKGEVFFDVAHNKKKPFIVGAKGIEVEVLGTEFNIEAYEDQDMVTTTLVEGSVKLTKNTEQVIIKPNQQASIGSNSSKFELKEVEARNYALWKDGVFYFEEANLATIMEKLERWYNIKVFYENQSIQNSRFSIEMKRYENISKILEIIEKTQKVKFEIKGNVITVRK
ncbi:FecR family protein [Ancylomarina sp. 16SWW S1-10-2]|uniref:FecR family protein n=1 Tax=Ancylomarina sp. 16SWW S1-10-2 TaxID=2499681 RepID=UPI0012AD3C77|nr:FecR family protein [Ancylomarina sp. 16SWW S1-10-2]MRT94714.1 FecR family protein [Ancylomarina sp. 16SWW S1-10-2]